MKSFENKHMSGISLVSRRPFFKISRYHTKILFPVLLSPLRVQNERGRPKARCSVFFSSIEFEADFGFDWGPLTLRHISILRFI